MASTVKQTPPPFVNLMPYDVMKSMMSSIGQYNSNQTNGEGHSSILNVHQDTKITIDYNSSINNNNNISTRCFDYGLSHLYNRNVKDITLSETSRDGCYKAHKKIIERADSLQTFLNETGSESSDISHSTEGDDGYFTDSHNGFARGTNLSSSSSSLISADSDITATVAKPGILKRNSDPHKTFPTSKRVTFSSTNKSSKEEFEESLEQKILALAIIDEESDEERLTRSSRSSSRSEHPTSSNESKHPPNFSINYNSKDSRQIQKPSCKFDRNQINSVSKPLCNNMQRASKQFQYQNIPTSVSPGLSPDVRGNMSCSAQYRYKENETVHSPIKRSVSNNFLSSNSEPQHQSSFAKSSDILKLFQNSYHSDTNNPIFRNFNRISSTNRNSLSSHGDFQATCDENNIKRSLPFKDHPPLTRQLSMPNRTAYSPHISPEPQYYSPDALPVKSLGQVSNSSKLSTLV